MAKFIRALAGEQHNIRIVACEAKDLIENATIKLGYPLTVSQCYGRALLASFLMAKLQKEGRLSLDYHCPDAMIERMSFVAGSDVLKGAILKADDMQILEYTSADEMLGSGQMTVVLESDNGEQFSSQSSLQTADIATEISAYFQISEQKPSVVLLSVHHDGREIVSAGAVIIQLLPNPAEEEIVKLEAIIPRLKRFSQLLEERLPLPEVVTAILGEDLAYKIIEESDFNYHCDCNRDKIEQALLALGRAELEDIVKEQGEAELHCHFCNSFYHFNRDDLRALISEIEK